MTDAIGTWLRKFAPLPSFFKAFAKAALLTQLDILSKWDKSLWWYLASEYVKAAGKKGKTGGGAQGTSKGGG